MNQYGKSRFGRFFVYCCELVGDILGRTLAKGFEKILNIGLTRYRTYLPHQNMFSNLKLTYREFRKNGTSEASEEIVILFCNTVLQPELRAEAEFDDGNLSIRSRTKKGSAPQHCYL